MYNLPDLDDVNLRHKNVLVRVDFNLPMQGGKVSDSTRISRSVPTIRDIIKVNGKAIILSHFGRPDGKIVPEMSLKQVVSAVEKVLNHKVIFVRTNWNDVSEAKKIIDEAPLGSVIILENTRFHEGEGKNDLELAKRMATLGEIYVMDAFSASHRAHASTEAIAHLLPSYAGRAMQKELKALSQGLDNPSHPVIAIIGGAKVSTKIDLIENLLKKVDGLVIGGAMANTFLYAMEIGIGNSLFEKDYTQIAKRIMDKADNEHCAIILPIDANVAWEFKAGAKHRFYGLDAIDPNGMILDIGPASIERIKGAIDEAKTIIWNGPLGAFECQPFDAGTIEIAKHVAKRTKGNGLVSVAGGGDTVAALAKANVINKLTYVSTAGGAFLEWMEGKPLPAIEALKASRDNKN